ncbi:hypothetical protein SS1G_09599 [Sclerotinia sclerotiorum 1980 UF-70]|uniref:Tyrosine specific protein phosphatases domain-containing protein n=1 Tax=Sclerotinia sclerotiorum (strain ATCC 18683 / 1980 / Ss-1) TaxID=665079 RepID=A7EW90_SCLS1|nr:hypothetical protein SS1G_09599 [Sclerotinia sclerotiorum 1980 UF-70]EDN93732.1 hypothetical protein SS1G_09599 [Sclerotinia sclerotiorum 1980 UF-70]
MATIALPRPIPAGHSRSSSPPHSHPLTPTLSLDSINASPPFPIPIPNKHLPVCPTGPAPAEKPDTPPHSPPTKELSLPQRSLLYPPVNYKSRYVDSSIIYEIDAAGVTAALEHLASQPLPDPSQVFPWFHGLHPCNHVQQAFFIQRRRTLRRTPKCIRGITIVKAGGDLTCSRLKGAITPDEFLKFGSTTQFQEVDPKDGFSVRNFHIQAAKSAMVSDIIVYGDDPLIVEEMARQIAAAQQVVQLQEIAEGKSDKWQLGFPSSGMIQPPSWEHDQADGILETCKWIYNLSHGILPEDEDGDSPMTTNIKERKILMHCTDGYTESTLLGLAYFTYATGHSIPKAWLDLHITKKHLLRHLGIKQILSVGETATWKDGEMDKWGKDNVMVIQRVQDNGVDPLTDEFGRCLDFIERGKLNNTATLVHCRVGVSRSATICIAEVMRTKHLSFPRAYCFVRARRLNVIIQPHLRFSYELLKWEEKLRMTGGKYGGKWRGRELEWAEIAREIAEMNRPYSAGR